MGRPPKKKPLSKIDVSQYTEEELKSLYVGLEKKLICPYCMLQFSVKYSFSRHLSTTCPHLSVCAICSFKRGFDIKQPNLILRECRELLLADMMQNTIYYKDLLIRRINEHNIFVIQFIAVMLEEMDQFFSQKGIVQSCHHTAVQKYRMFLEIAKKDAAKEKSQNISLSIVIKKDISQSTLVTSLPTQTTIDNNTFTNNNELVTFGYAGPQTFELDPRIKELLQSPHSSLVNMTKLRIPLSIRPQIDVKTALLTLVSQCASSKDLDQLGNHLLLLAKETRECNKIVFAYDYKQLKIVVWENQFGPVATAICPMCNQKPMRWYDSDWDLSHIVSKKAGGALIEINLRPYVEVAT